MNLTDTTDRADQLRDQMTSRIVDGGHIGADSIEETMRAVPRHQFVPAASLDDAYADQAVITKRAADGSSLSCASVPSMVATMLTQLDVRPGQHILEIGAGTGYNAALLARLAGPSGQVTTIDIDPDVTAGARTALAATGYAHVAVLTGDGAAGAPARGPFDRIIVTAGAWDIPSAWRQQLAPAGRLVVPLRWRGQTRTVAFAARLDGKLVSDSVSLCGFVPMIGHDGEQTGQIDATGPVALHWDAGQLIDAVALAGVLRQPAATTWAGVTVGPEESFDGVWLRLTATEPATCRIAAGNDAIRTGLCTPPIPARSPALARGCSLAYFTQRRLPDQVAMPRWELGATGHGLDGTALAAMICAQIRAWDNNRTATPVITACPAVTAIAPIQGGLIIDKPCTRLTVQY